MSALDRRERLQQRLLEVEPVERSLACRAVNAYAGFFEHPAPSLRVGIGEIAELARGQEVALDVLDARFDDPFLRRIGRWARVDLKP